MNSGIEITFIFLGRNKLPKTTILYRHMVLENYFSVSF